MKKLTPEQERRMNDGVGAIASAFLLAIAMILFILAVPSWDASVNAAWDWFLSFRGIWS